MIHSRLLWLLASSWLLLVAVWAALSAAASVSAVDHPILIEAVYYDGQLTQEPDEAIRLVNRGRETINLAGWSLNDSLTDTSALIFPAGIILPPGERLWVAKEAVAFQTSFGFSPTLSAVDLSGSWIGLANGGDEVVLRDDGGQLIDLVLYEASSAVNSTSAWVGAPLQPYKIHHGTAVEGQILYRKLDPVTGFPVADTNTAADWAQDPDDPIWGRKIQYPGWDLTTYRHPATITASGRVTVAVAPDHSFEFLATLIDQAQEEILIETHTFENPAIAEHLAAAADRGLTVTLLMEGGPPGGVSDQAKVNCELLQAAGGRCWVMVSDQQLDIFDRYDYLHGKFLIIDRLKVVISSENLSPNSLPADSKDDGTWGRRGLLMAIESPQLVEYFRALWEADFDPQRFADIQPITFLGGPDPGFVPSPPANPTTYTIRFPAAVGFSGSFPMEVIQSPENSLVPEEGFLGLIAQADVGDVILSQQLSERPVWQSGHPYGGNQRLELLIEAARRGAAVWLMLDGYFDDPAEPLSNAATCRKINTLAAAEKLDLHCQVQNPAGLGIHNKMMVFQIDGRGYSHLGSINGTEQSFKANREIGVTIEHDELSAYLTQVFWSDWRFPVFMPVLFSEFIGPADHLLISEILPDPYGAGDGAEFIELVNPTPYVIQLAGIGVSDALRQDEFADLRRFPAGAELVPGETVVVAQQGSAFFEQFGFYPHYEILNSVETVPNLIDDPQWGDPNQFLRLGNGGDVVIVRDDQNRVIDAIGYGNRAYGGRPICQAPPPGHSLRRRPYWRDWADCPRDFEIWPAPDPGRVSG